MTTTDDEKRLLVEIAHFPDDNTLREMWAGIAEKRGDPRAELVRVQLARRAEASAEYQTFVGAKETELLARHRLEWTAEIRKLGVAKADLAGGFVETILVDARALLSNARAVKDAAPIRRVELAGDVRLVPELIAAGAFEHVCWIVLSGLRPDAAVLDALARLPGLRALGLSRCGLDDALVERLWAAFPRLLVCDIDHNPCAELYTKDLTYQEMSTYEWFNTERATALEVKYGRRMWTFPSRDPSSERPDLEMLLARIAKKW